MSENELAIADQPLTIKALANMLGGTVLPARYASVGDAVATIKIGQEIGLPEMTALNELYVVNGSVGMSGKAMMSLIFRAGHIIKMSLSPDEGRAHAWRRDPFTHELIDMGEFTFTREDAETAGLIDKDNYKGYPTDMLGWKAVARAVRFAFPDVIMGYLPGEIGFDVEEEKAPIDEAFDDTLIGHQIDIEEAILEAEEVAEILDGEVTE